MKRVTAAENCLPHTNGMVRGTTPRTQRLCEEVATRYSGPFTEIKDAWGKFKPSDGASHWTEAAERFVFIRDRLSAYIRQDDLIAGALVRGDGPVSTGWKPAGEDFYINHFAQTGPKEPQWVYDMASRGLISPQGPFNHKVVDYEGFLRTGSLNVIKRAEELLASREGLAREITEGFIEGHKCMIRTAERYAAAYEALADNTKNEQDKCEFIEMARICKKVPAHPAGTFYEAIQMLWFAYMVAGDGTGRPDQYLYDYYRADTDAGNISEERVLELIEAFMIKLHSEYLEGIYNVSSVQTLTLGGCDSNGKDACNELTRLFLRAIRSVRLLRPTVYVRCTDETPQDILDLSIAMLGEGLGEPNFFGDKPVVEGLTRLGVPAADARDYALSGCAEIVSPAKGNWGAPNGWINMAQLTLEALHETAEDRENISIENFWTVYSAACKKVAEACAIANKYVDDICINYRYESTIMYPCCLERGLDSMRGGMDTYFGHWEGVGLPNSADMVYAAFYLLDKNGDTLNDLLQKTESGDDEFFLASLRKLPKFGNDIDDVDLIAAKLVRILSESLEAQNPGLRSALMLGHLAGGENMHIAYGKHMPATLDGRRAGQPLADSMAACHGYSAVPTAMIKSLCKLDHSRLQAGNVSTMRLTPADFATAEGRGNVSALIRTFVASGGSQLQFNVLDADLLREAQKNPEQHAGIIVRVAGYSSVFDGLGKIVQDEIIARYESLE
ncbi:MAG: hypothetical protein FWE82_09320 [Defluviitaleaceae bacterium]|nr:hypothetical protein [Defluviitaleaceae bacterium]